MKNAFKKPDVWGANNVDELTEILNQVDVPENYIELIQKLLDRIAGSLSSLTESAWGEDI